MDKKRGFSRLLGTTREGYWLMDDNLPGMSGLEAVRRIRPQPEIASLPVVALSSAATKKNRPDGDTAGFDRYLTKPLYLRNLKGLLQHYLGDDA